MWMPWRTRIHYCGFQLLLLTQPISTWFAYSYHPMVGWGQYFRDDGKHTLIVHEWITYKQGYCLLSGASADALTTLLLVRPSLVRYLILHSPTSWKSKHSEGFFCWWLLAFFTEAQAVDVSEFTFQWMLFLSMMDRSSWKQNCSTKISVLPLT